MNIKDEKKITKDFIEYIFQWVLYEYTTKGHDGFMYTISDNKLSYIIADKGIEKRLEKLFIKELNIKTEVSYESTPSHYKYGEGILRIKILQD